MMLLAVIPRSSETEQLLTVLYTNTGIAGFGLLVTAIQQTVTNQLSLFHATFVLHILLSLGISVASVGRYSWTTSRIVMLTVAQYISQIAFTAWALYLWIRVDEFGSQPNLNDKVKVVVMFANVKVTAAWLRGVCITFFAICAFPLMMVLGHSGLTLCSMLYHLLYHKERPREETGALVDDTYSRAVTYDSSYSSYCECNFLPLNAIYAIVMLELTVRRNSTQHGGIVQVDNTWTFGQTLSLVMFFANIKEIVNWLVHMFELM